MKEVLRKYLLNKWKSIEKSILIPKVKSILDLDGLGDLRNQSGELILEMEGEGLGSHIQWGTKQGLLKTKHFEFQSNSVLILPLLIYHSVNIYWQNTNLGSMLNFLFEFKPH